VKGIEASLTALKTSLRAEAPAKIEEHLKRHKKVLERKVIVTNTIADLNLEIEKNKLASEKLHHEIKKIEEQLVDYEENREAIENLEGLLKEQKRQVALLNNKNTKLTMCEDATMELVRTNGSLEHSVEAIKEDKAEYQNLQEEYAAYDLFMRAMHSNGIAYDVIKKKLPVINQEVAKVLTNITNFEVFFEDNGKKFDIFIKHPAHDARPIEMASGAEKTMSAMAIRLAMLSVSSLPKGDLFVLDEPGTSLDEDNMEGFIRILELIKVYFKNVLLISHLDSLKDCVDMQIVIDKTSGYAKINH
jgi:exonuclease SbcC